MWIEDVAYEETGLATSFNRMIDILLKNLMCNKYTEGYLEAQYLYGGDTAHVMLNFCLFLLAEPVRVLTNDGKPISMKVTMVVLMTLKGTARAVSRFLSLQMCIAIITCAQNSHLPLGVPCTKRKCEVSSNNER